MQPLFDRAIYINRSTDGLLQASHGPDPSEPLVDNKPWKTGQELFVQAAASGNALPLIFAHYAELTFWAVATDIARSGKSTSFTFTHLQAIQGRERSDLIVASTGLKLPNNFIRSYAIVRTPNFLSAQEGVLDFSKLPTESGTRTLSEDLRSILTQKIESTTKDALVSARIGQGKFRTQVLGQWGDSCSVTGSVTHDAIRASHIKPWRESTDEERLDPNNGLPLVANLDALFDAGLISFDSSGKMIVSPKLKGVERSIFSVDERSLRRTPSAKTGSYLGYHRNRVFRG